MYYLDDIIQKLIEYYVIIIQIIIKFIFILMIMIII
jgi:hypothetical protein